MTDAAKSGIGATFGIGNGDGPPETFDNVAEIVSIAGPNIQGEQIDSTTLDSPGGAKQFIAGLKDYGTIDLELLFTGTTEQDELRTAVENGTASNFKLTLPTATPTVGTFAGLPLSWSQNTTANDPMRANVSIKISGAIVWT